MKKLRFDDFANRSQVITGATDLDENTLAFVVIDLRFDCQFLLKCHFDGRNPRTPDSCRQIFYEVLT